MYVLDVNILYQTVLHSVLFIIGDYDVTEMKGLCQIMSFCVAEPTVYFGSGDYEVDESEGFVEVAVWRTGTDLSKPSSVTVRSKKSNPKSAEGQ